MYGRYTKYGYQGQNKKCLSHREKRELKEDIFVRLFKEDLKM